MPPDIADAPASAAARARAAEAVHREIAAVYDALETHLAAASWDDAAALVPRLEALEADLRPLADARRLATADQAALWAAADALAGAIERRRAAALRLTSAVRAATAARLGALHASRARAARYRSAPADAVFASRRA